MWHVNTNLTSSSLEVVSLELDDELKVLSVSESESLPSLTAEPSRSRR